MSKVKKTELFERLGAKLTNIRWGWDAVDEKGNIYFVGWEDEEIAPAPDGSRRWCIFADGHPANERLGGKERLRHIQQLLIDGSAGYLVIAKAKDPRADPRRIDDFDSKLYTVRLDQERADIFASVIAENSAPDFWNSDFEDDADHDWDDSEISETDRKQLGLARRGQGLFRRRLERIEAAGCRLTGVRDRAHLRASHIKPWKAASNRERLDGYNGLLLAPHVDHLFDRGFISFEDSGRLLISPRLDVNVLRAWSITPAFNGGKFHPRQCAYLAFHRNKFGFD